MVHTGCVCACAQSCPTLCDPMDCNLPGSSVHGILQARTLERLPLPSPGDLPDPGIKLKSLASPVLADRCFTAEPTGNPVIWDKIQIPILQNGTHLSVLLKSYYFHQLQSQTKISNTFKIHQSAYQKSQCWGLPNSWLGWDDSILTAVSQFGKLVVSVFPHTQSLGPYQWQAFKVRFKVFTVVLTVLKSRSTSHCLTFMWVWSLSEPSKVALCCMLSRFSCVWLSATLWTIYSPPGSSVHGVLQARILVWVAMPGSRGSSQLRDQTHVSYISCIGRWVFTTGTIWKAQGGSGFSYKSSPVVELLPWTIIRSLTKVVYYLHTAYNAIRVGCLELFYSNHLRRKP